LSKLFSFKGGITIPHSKEQITQTAIEHFPAPYKVIIPLLQHNGATAHPTVKRGDPVSIGQLIGEQSGHNSLAVHSSVSGEVLSIGLFPHPNGRQILAVEIENNFKDDKAYIQPYDRPWQEAAPQELIQKIQQCGIAGMSGEGTPTHLKLSQPSNKTIHTVILNACETEPFIASDTRLLIEKTEDILNGFLILKKITGATKALIGVDNKQQSVYQALQSRIADPVYKDISVVKLKSKYPQGAERQLIYAVTKKAVPLDGSAADAGSMVFSPSTSLAVHDAIIDGFPLYQRVISVNGSSVGTPKNYLVRLGTPIRTILDTCKCDMTITKKVISGGPMTGITQSDLDAPVIKTTTGIFAFDKITPAMQDYPCINCGSCVKACPQKLVPSRIAKYVKMIQMKKAAEWNFSDCIECGACSYVCPSRINLVHFIKLAKCNVSLSKNRSGSTR
jgi:electron transport complex protein RnfC